MGSNPDKPSKRQSDPEGHIDAVLAAVKSLWVKYPNMELVALLRSIKAFDCTVSNDGNLLNWHKGDDSLVKLITSNETIELLEERRKAYYKNTRNK